MTDDSEQERTDPLWFQISSLADWIEAEFPDKGPRECLGPGDVEALREAKCRLRGGEGERLHREAKRDVSQLMRVVEDLETVRVTCHNGHTSTLRELRDEEDCSAPCCPRSGCDECSFTLEPSDALSPTDGEEGERLDEVGRTPMEALEDRARSVADEIDRWGDVHPAHIGALVRVADIVLSAAPTDGEEGGVDAGLLRNLQSLMVEAVESPVEIHKDWQERFARAVHREADPRPEEAGGEDVIDWAHELERLAGKFRDAGPGLVCVHRGGDKPVNPQIGASALAQTLEAAADRLRGAPEGAGEADCYAKAKMGSLTLYVPCETRDIKMADQGMVAILRPIWQEEWECVPANQTMHAPHLPDDATVVGLRTGREGRDDG